MAVAGLKHMHQPEHALQMVRFACELVARAATLSFPRSGEPLQVRVGLATGPVAAGIVGKIRRKYTVMGSTVSRCRHPRWSEIGALPPATRLFDLVYIFPLFSYL
jgi:class 3 adenylate cyclase